MSLKSWSIEVGYFFVRLPFICRSIIRSLAHPVVVFALLQIIWVTITVAWLVWFSDVKKELSQLTKALSSAQGSAEYAYAFLNIGSVLLGMLLVGTAVVFAFGQRQGQLVRKQRSFFSSVTHELRSPLSSLQLAIETLRAKKMDKKTTDQMYEMILADIKRLLRLVDNVLVSARLDRGITSVQGGGKRTEVTRLTPIIKKAIDMVSYLDKDLAARVVVECPEDFELSIAEPELQLVMNNLIENAAKYSPPGAQIHIRVTEDAIKRQQIVSVQDQGIGLEKSDLRQVFNMFFRSDEVCKKAISGTGLGLFIVRSTIKACRGEVWAESPGPGHGSTFFISLPMPRKTSS